MAKTGRTTTAKRRRTKAVAPSGDDAAPCAENAAAPENKPKRKRAKNRTKSPPQPVEAAAPKLSPPPAEIPVITPAPEPEALSVWAAFNPLLALDPDLPTDNRSLAQAPVELAQPAGGFSLEDPRDLYLRPADCDELMRTGFGAEETDAPGEHCDAGSEAPVLGSVLHEVRRCTPVAPAAPKSDQGYLRRVREAVCAEGERQRADDARVTATLKRKSGALLSLGLGAATLIILAGTMPTREGRAAALASAAGAATPPPTAAASRAAAYADDYAEAMRLIAGGQRQAGVRKLRRAAEGGFPAAQYRLSKLYDSGEVVQRDLVRAREWAARAAEAGNVRAMHDLGVYLARGEGASLDEAAAFRWFRQAAEFGVSDSQYNLGVLYQSGRGVVANPSEALFWFLVAARNGDANAIDRIVELSAALPTQDAAVLTARARAFSARAPDPAANPASPIGNRATR